MLDPFLRRHLIDALRPPPDHTLDRAIGTTYSLDLLALLTAPLAFTFFDYEADDTQADAVADPLALLEALRRNADRITIFCDAGRIIVPRTSQPLYSYLEASIYQIDAPLGGVFHPKVWLLRFLGPNGGVSYRLLCLSRNLTFDRSWDTALVLDGVLKPDSEVRPENQPLSAFIAALPGLVMGKTVPETLRAEFAQIANELTRVSFDPPGGFDSLAFHPLGLSELRHNPFDQPIDRMLIVSPFLTANMLRQLAAKGRDNILIARQEELQVQPQELLRRFHSVYTLSEAANLENVAAEQEGATAPVLAGLHAKLYIGDSGERAHIWTGSANASDAAFERNVEFLVRLSGMRTNSGVDAVLGRDRETGLHALLERFDPSHAGEQLDEVQQRLDDLVEYWQREIARLGFAARVRSTAESERFDVYICTAEENRRSLPSSLTTSCWPISIAAGKAVPLQVESATAARFSDLAYDSLTSFYAFEVTVREGARRAQTSFVLNLPLEGAPADRRQRLLRSLLQNRTQVLRFLMLLLSDQGAELDNILKATRALTEGAHGSGDGQIVGLPLFEAMVRTLDRDPPRLEYVARLIDDLRATPETRTLLPDDFDVIWEPIRAAYQQSR